MTVPTLRPCQRAAVDAVFGYWRSGGAGNPLVEMATGTGKSVVIATLLRELLAGYPGLRILCLVHVRELVAQNHQQLLRLWPEAPAGIFCAGLGRRDTEPPILFASIQSVFRNPERLGRRDLVIVDEAHLIPAAGEGMYRRLLAGLAAQAPDLRVAGLTATPYRLDSGRLDRGPDRLFDRIVFSYGIAAGVADGYLAPLTARGMKAEIDVSGVARRGGEFVASALEAAADHDSLIRAAAAEIVAHGADRRSWLVFCCGIDHARHVRDALQALGIAAETVTGQTPAPERDRILSAFRAGQLRAVCNVAVLTTGFDAPGVDLVALLRPTLSTGLYVQMLGRGTRTAPGKANCLVLDFAGNVRRHGPVDRLRVASAGGGRGGRDGTDGESTGRVTPDSIRARACPRCEALQPVSAAVCRDCGHEWPEELRHDARPGAAAVMTADQPVPEWLPVTGMACYLHRRRNAPFATPTLRVAFDAGIGAVNQWLCFSHPQGSLPQRRAADFWLDAGGNLPVPASVAEALERQAELSAPEAVLVRVNDRGFEEVVRHRWRRAGEAAA